MPAPEVIYSTVEPIGGVRLEPGGDPVAMEFAAEVLRVDGAVVDLATQAVFDDDGCVELSWLHPRREAGEQVDVRGPVVRYVTRGVLPPLNHAVNSFYLLIETCAGLHVCDRAGVLAGAELVGARPAGATALLDDGLALYGCAAPEQIEDGWRVRVGELFVPRFWIRPAGSGEPHFEAPRWSAAGYSRAYLDDVRARVLPVPAPWPSIVAFDAGQGGPGATDEQIATCRAAGAEILPRLDGLALADRSRLFAQMLALVTVHDESNVNLIFMSEGTTFAEVLDCGDTPGQFAVLSDLRGLSYVPSAPMGDGRRSSDDPDLLGSLLSTPTGHARTSPPPIHVLTGVWDNADLLDDWLDHHRRLGVASVLAVDFGSTDGSVELLCSSRWSDFVEVVPFPGLVADHSRLLVQAARSRWTQGWGVLIDPDEFIVTATGDLESPDLRGAMAAADVVVLPRFEMTAPRSTAESARPGRPDAADLTLRLVGQDQGKVVVDLATDAEPSLSAHEGVGRACMVLSDPRTCILHAPVRSFDRYAQKVDHAATTLAANAHLDDGFAWHWRRWIQARADGGLPAEYLAQFVDDTDVDRLVADGTYVPDLRLASAIDSVRRLRADRR